MMARWKALFCTMGALVFFATTGCSGSYLKSYGRIIPEGNVTGAFETYQIDPDLTYYISGADSYPNAIMGLNKAYTLESTLWKKIAMTPQTLRELVSSMQSMERPQFGFTLFDNKGNRIGIWYSILTAPTSIRITDDHTVVIPTPDLDTYESFHKGDPNREE